ncbi:MAG: 30S ribosomal protein S6 [bacterium]|nr:30S ribosomal protein S6 [bacterium]
MSDETKQYEISIVFSSEEAYPSVISFIKGKVGQISFESPVRRIRLAYPIKKEETGFFAWLIVESSPEVMPVLQKDLERNPVVLRALIITPPLPAKTERRAPSMKEKEVKVIQHEEPIKSMPVVEPIRETRSSEALSNELLEKKLEEILK